MLFNVYDFSDQEIGQVEAKDIIEAWGVAGKKYENVLNVVESRWLPRGERFSPISGEAVIPVDYETRIDVDLVSKLRERLSYIEYIAAIAHRRALSEHRIEMGGWLDVALDGLVRHVRIAIETAERIEENLEG